MKNHQTVYSVHPSLLMVQKWLTTLKDKTGRSLDEWMLILKEEGPKTELERRTWLKETFSLGTNSAYFLAERSFGKGHEEDTPEAYLKQAEIYVKELFSGKKAHLKPLYDALLTMGFNLGKEVKVCPCKTIIPFYRQHVFAQIKPMSNRLDIGFALKNRAVTGRLIDTGGFAKKDRITHRIPICSMADIDQEVHNWLKTAYEMDE